jgi:hypothetical protein
VENQYEKKDKISVSKEFLQKSNGKLFYQLIR